MTKVLVLDSLLDSLDIERQAAATHDAVLERWDGSDDQLGSAEVIAHVRTRVDREMIARLTRCRAIARFGTGLDTVDREAAARAGIAVVAVRDYCTRELASHTLAIAFTVSRRLDVLRRHARDGESWQQVANASPIAGRSRATVVGLGAVGIRVADALVTLGYEVRVVTRHGLEKAKFIGAYAVTLEQGLRSADLVFLHCELNEETHQLINAETLSVTKPGAILVNTARLGLLNEAAVATAVAGDHLGGLAIDARLDDRSPLRELIGDPRVVVTPHTGWYSEESSAELRRRAISEGLAAAATNTERTAPSR